MKIIFMGTPEIAVHCLDILRSGNHEISAVVTTPDKPAGRGRKLSPSAIKKYAVENNLNILQPEKLKNPDFISQITKLKPDLIVVVAFRMLPKDVWQIPKFGTINLHASLLPQYRGAAPINWAIINGEEKTGVTTFFIDEKIDTGKIILQKEISIEQTDNAGTLHDKIMIQGADILLETVNLIEKNQIDTIEQHKIIKENKQLKPAPKIYKTDCRINWNNDTINVYNFIRGLNPYPGAWAYLNKNNKDIITKIFDVEIENISHNNVPGTIIFDKKNLKIATKNGYIKVKTLKSEGRKKLKANDFIQGFDLKNCIFN